MALACNASGPDEDFRLRLEALKDFTADERNVAREILDSLILKHAANRFSASSRQQEPARANG